MSDAKGPVDGGAQGFQKIAWGLPSRLCDISISDAPCAMTASALAALSMRYVPRLSAHSTQATKTGSARLCLKPLRL